MHETELKFQIRDITSVIRDVNVKIVQTELKKRGYKTKPSHIFRLMESMAKEGLYELFDSKCDICGKSFNHDDKILGPPWKFVHNDKSLPNHTFCNPCHVADKAQCKS